MVEKVTALEKEVSDLKAKTQNIDIYGRNVLDPYLDVYSRGVIFDSMRDGLFTTFTLVDGATINTDCRAGNHFVVTLGGNRTLANPTGATDGQRIIFEFIQDGTGTRTITLGSKFALGTDISGVTLTTTVNKRDFMGVIYRESADKFYVVAFVKGY